MISLNSLKMSTDWLGTRQGRFLCMLICLSAITFSGGRVNDAILYNHPQPLIDSYVNRQAIVSGSDQDNLSIFRQKPLERIEPVCIQNQSSDPKKNIHAPAIENLTGQSTLVEDYGDYYLRGK